MDEVVTFAGRSEMPALLHAAIAHAQSSRSGRALIDKILGLLPGAPILSSDEVRLIDAPRNSAFDAVGQPATLASRAHLLIAGETRSEVR
jgi:hypothetical protein